MKAQQMLMQTAPAEQDIHESLELATYVNKQVRR